MDDLLLVGDHVNEFVGDDLRVQVVEPNPVEVQFAQLLQKSRQGGAVLQVQAVPGDVLGDDDQFLGSPGLQLPGLPQKGVHGAAAVPAPQLGDDAEGTAVAAPLGDLQIGGIGRGGHHPLPVVIGPVDALEVLRVLPGHELLHRRHHVGVAAGAQHAVHLGQLFPDVVRVALGEAARHQQLFQLALVLQLGELQNVLDGLAFGGLNKAAGVQHRHVGPLRVAGDGVAGVPAQGHHLLGVHQVLGTAERDKGYFVWHHHRSNVFLFFSQEIPPSADGGLLCPRRQSNQNAAGDAADGLRLRFAPPRSIGLLSPDPITGDAYLSGLAIFPARKI